MYEPALLEEDTSLRAWWHLARAGCRLISHLTPFVERFGVTGPQFGVIRTLGEAGPDGLPLGQLSERLLVSCGNITGIVDRLEDAGYLYRERSDEDRRVVIARLTPPGEALYDEAIPVLVRAVEEAMSALDPREQVELARLTRKLELAIADSDGDGARAGPPELAPTWREHSWR